MSITIATLGKFGFPLTTVIEEKEVIRQAGGAVGGIHMPPKCSVTVERVRIDDEDRDKRYIKVLAIRTKNGNGDDV